MIKGAVEIIKGRIDLKSPKTGHPLLRIERAISEMESLIETFLFLARHGQKPDEDTRCDLVVVVNTVVDSCRHLLESKPVDINLSIPDSQIVQAPESLVSIAIGNLVRNAFMYIDEGKVEISVLKDKLVVQDNGPGIDPAQQGKGLGLTIVRRLCERMQWTFNIVSRQGDGTRAELIFKTSK